MGKKRRPGDVRYPPAPRQQNQTDSVLIERRQSFSGPIPPPALIQGWEQYVPNAGERVFAMAEAEAKHRHTIEQAEQRRLAQDDHADQVVRKRAQVFAFIFLMSLFGAGVAFAFLGKPIEGVVTLVGLAASVIGYFKVGKKALKESN